MPALRNSPPRPRPSLAALAVLLAALLSLPAAFAQAPLPEDTARIHYQRPDGAYDGWVLHVWEDPPESVTWAQGLEQTGADDWGVYWDVGLQPDAARLGLIVHVGDTKDPGPDMFINFAQHGFEIWVVSGSDTIHSERPVPPPGQGVARVHYLNPSGDLEGWVLHVWEDTLEQVTWTEGLQPSGQVSGGLYWDVRLTEAAEKLGFIVHRGDEKDPGPDMFVDLAEFRNELGGSEVWMVTGSTQLFDRRPEVAAAGGGDLRSARAHWLAPDLLAWRTGVALPDDAYQLVYAADGGLALEGGSLVGGATFDLEVDESGLPAELLARFPHLAGYTALRVSENLAPRVPELLRGQLAVVRLAGGEVTDATGVQLAGVLDALYATDAPLGVNWSAGGTPTVSVWAPTARSVNLLRFSDPQVPEPERLSMTRDDATGVWSLVGEPGWKWQYYLFEVEVYAPSVAAVVTNQVTDPYSVSLAQNSRLSQFVDLADPMLAPDGWTNLVKPAVADPVDIVIYELHLRDYSASDPLVPADLKGTYLAFTLDYAHGAQHLRALSAAGLTHLHLLPTFDIATIDEDKSTWLTPDITSVLPTGSSGPQAAVSEVRDLDAFNWGYDPLHYNVPEGSYATHADGPARIVEYRQMVMALWDLGLYVVADVVYNHTNAAGQSARSVLDRIVPGYYHRLDEAGNVTTSPCCQNTATEHDMMRRLMVDSVRLWAEHYKIDAFRFDLMGHHMVSDMLAVRAALDGLSVAANGVDDPGVYVYGEGWDFGEVALNARGANATQINMAGTGIGTFNDRLRDAVRGGGPFDGPAEIVGNQGFASGRYVLPNAANEGGAADLASLLRSMDQLRVGLAGNLAAFTFEGAAGEAVRGDEVDYNGSPAGYGAVPQDHIVYVSKHDNQTLWDILQYKLPAELSTADRVRLQNLALSTVAFSQGVPFFHAGSDLLRSKSFDRNSYDSGDWFNYVDWSGRTTGMGRGVPPGGDNRDMWQLIRPMLTDPLMAPGADDLAFSSAVFREWLSIRAQEPLLRLRTAEDVMARLTFHNTGPQQVPGVIVMQLRDDLPTMTELAPGVDRLLVVFNTSPVRATVTVPEAAGKAWLLHEVQASGVDAGTLRGAFVVTANGRVAVPPLSTVVFVAPDLVHLGTLRFEQAMSPAPRFGYQVFVDQAEPSAPPIEIRRLDFSQPGGRPPLRFP